MGEAGGEGDLAGFLEGALGFSRPTLGLENDSDAARLKGALLGQLVQHVVGDVPLGCRVVLLREDLRWLPRKAGSATVA